jgi:hypothetical protein
MHMRTAFVLAVAAVLAGCAAGTRARQNMQTQGGSSRLDPVAEHAGR